MQVFLVWAFPFVIAFVYGVFVYKSLLAMQAGISMAWSVLDEHLKSRYDLIPHLVSFVERRLEHEKSTVECVIRARDHAMSTEGDTDQGTREAELAAAISRLFDVAGDCPDTLTDPDHLNLQSRFANTQEAIRDAGVAYNSLTADYNLKVDSIPELFVARLFKFDKLGYFSADDSQRELPKINEP